MHNRGQSGALPLINVLKPLAKSVLISLGLTAAAAAAAATGAAIHKKMFGSAVTTLIVSNEEINNIMKIIKSKILFINKRSEQEN